jgi:hypothetical protein
MRKSAKWSWLITVVVLLAAGMLTATNLSVCHAQSNTGNTQLRASKSKYYTVHSTARQAEVEFVKRYMDMLFETYQKRFSEFNRRDNSPMNLYLFDTREQYQQFLSRQQFGAASTSGGVFFVNDKDKGLATYIEARDPEWTLQTLRHEGFHQFAYAFIGHNLPLWVNEGLAEYFAEGIVVQGKIMPGIVPQRRLAAVRQAIANGSAFDFPELISMTSQRWQHLMETRADHGAMLYNQSWSMVHFLIHGDNGRYTKAFGQYLSLLANDVPSAEAFKQAFGDGDSAMFRRRWEQYMASLQPDAFSSALDDMRFLAMGMRLIAEQKDAPTPRTFHQLKRMLQQGNFYVVQQGHGQNFRLEASDDELFSYTLPNGESKPYLLLEPARNDLPPRLTAPGLRPEPTINWTRNEKNDLVFRIDFR